MNKVKEIDDICKKYNIKNYVINKNGRVDVNGDVKIWGVGFKILPLKFNIINGDCDISVNKLITLEGSPVYVDGFFNCSNNELTSLKYSPKEIKRDFDCSINKLKILEDSPGYVGGNYICGGNQLISLIGSPICVNGDFNCSNNELTSLEYSPKEIRGIFSCSYNELKTLEYGPEKVAEGYYCRGNKLTSLKNTPKIIYGDFNCDKNKLKSLKYGPEMVYGNYDCSFNELKNLKGCAKYIRDGLFINNNPDLYTLEGLIYSEPKILECKNTIFYNVWKLFKDVSKIELFNDMDIIRENNEDKPVIILNRLNEFLDMIEKPRVEKVEGYINI